MTTSSRREFFGQSMRLGAAALAVGSLGVAAAQDAAKKGSKIRYGLVTYQWAKDWDLPTIIANCTTAGVPGVELRTTHKHGVEPSLSAAERAEVKKRFDDSPVTFVGIGSDERLDSPDPAVLDKAVEATKAFVLLSRDVGGSGVKVKPNSFHPGVDHDVTIEQIGKTLNVLGAFGADYGQQIRLEVHGECCKLPTMAKIMAVVDHPNVGLCWNSNGDDLGGEGLEYNFNLVKNRLGATTHIHEMDSTTYPFQQLLDLFVGIDYDGWMMLESGNVPPDPVKALADQYVMFKEMLAKAQG